MTSGRNRLDQIETAAELEIIAYSSSVEWRKNQLVSAAQYRSALSKNIVDFDTPLVRLADAEARATAAEATVTALQLALKPFAALQVPSKPQGNAGAYSIRHADIETARKALATIRRRTTP